MGDRRKHVNIEKKNTLSHLKKVW